jgi:hypothetical protein
MSSSLAGALVSPDAAHYDKTDASSADVDMHPSSFDDTALDTATDLYPKHDEEMGDLFGEDANVDFVHHSRLVPRQATAAALPSSFRSSTNTKQ